MRPYYYRYRHSTVHLNAVSIVCNRISLSAQCRDSKEASKDAPGGGIDSYRYRSDSDIAIIIDRDTRKNIDNVIIVLLTCKCEKFKFLVQSVLMFLSF